MTTTKKRLTPEQKYGLMTRAERRVAIAKDVIKWVQQGAFGEVESGQYVGASLGASKGVLNTCTVNQSNAACIARACSVCARGAMLLTKLANYNHGEVGFVPYGGMYESDTRVGLADAFSLPELQAIECAFEQSDGFLGSQPRKARDAVLFGLDHYNPEDRLIAICQNIIDHKGTFKPSVRYVTYWAHC